MAPGAAGLWAGHAREIAVFDVEGWVFFVAQAGWRAEVLAEAVAVVFDGMNWIGPQERPQIVGQLGVATSPDETNRLAVSSAATLLTHAGQGHQLKLNKATAGDTASLLFQTGFSGRAEMGLAGNDDFSVKVSGNGTTFSEGLRIASTGAVTLPAGALVPDGTAALPGLRFAADPDTGLVRGGANQIGLVAGGVQRALLSATALQLDVPLTGSAVQADSHDATAGRTARLFASGGIFGWGVAQGQSLGPIVADASGVAVSGLYRTDATTLNLPAAAASGLLEVFHGAGGDAIQQRWSATTADNAPRIWMRRFASGVWQAWTLLYSQSTLLGPVSQSAGVPTGGAMQRGSSTNGEFVRLADGTQICTRSNLATPNASTPSGTLFRSADVAWTYPAAFAVAPVVTGSVDDLDSWLVAGVPSVTAVTVRALASASKAAALTLRCVAVGRWF